MKLTHTPFAKQLRRFKFLARKADSMKKSGEFDRLPEGRRMALTNALRRIYNNLVARVSNGFFKKWALRIAAVLGLTGTASAQATIQFAPPVASPFNITTVGTYFSPRAFDYVDIDNDGDLDLFVGGTNQSPVQYCYYTYYGVYCYTYYVNRGRVFYMQNTGTPAAATFAAPVVNPFNLNVDSLSNALSPQFADIDNDGDMDAFFGTQYGGSAIRYYPNIGTAAAPNFGPRQNNPFTIGVGPAYSYGFPKVVFADMNNDGDLDLMSGKLYYGGGNFTYQPNNGTAAAATFGTFQTNPFALAPVNNNRNAFDLADIDFDGDLDLFAQNFSYATGTTINFYPNTGTLAAATFGPAQGNPFSIAPATGGSPSDVDFADIDNDGDMDMFSINNQGIVNFHENISTRGSIQFSQASLNVPEPVGGVFLPIELSVADTTRTITVTLELLLTGTATDGQDFTFSSPQTVTFAPGVTGPLYVNVPINNDLVIEGTETIEFRLIGPSQGITLGTNSTFTVNIDDDDVNAPRLAFNSSSLSVNENAGTVSFDVTLANPNANATAVTVIALPSSATITQDYTFTSTTVTFPAGSTTPQTVTLNVIDDLVFEGTEDIILGFFNPTNGAVFGTNDQLTISITDNDIQPPTLQFANATFTVNENVGSVDVDINIATANNNPTSVTVSISGTSSATGGLDFSLPINTIITFPANSTTAQTLNIPIIDDSNLETSEEIVLNLTSPTNGALLGANATVSIFITDNDVIAIGTIGWNENDLRLYPNPVQEQLTIEVTDYNDKAIILMDVNGRQLQMLNLSANTASVDMSQLPAGTYFVQLRDTVSGKFLTKRIVKN